MPGLGGARGAFVITGNLTNSGTVNLAGPIRQPLTVIGNYGPVGVLSLNTYLGADARRRTLVVDGGAATGATALRITNQAGPGAKTTGDGIQVVQAINGGTTAPGAFTSGGIHAAPIRTCCSEAA